MGIRVGLYKDIIMEDFISYGQTTMPANAGIDNPAANMNGLIGEVQFPYVVPAEKQLILTGWGFEGLNKAFGVCIPWIGEMPVSNEKCLASVGPSQASYYVTGMRWVIPAGKKLNVRLLNGTDVNNVVCAWFVQGYLESINNG